MTKSNTSRRIKRPASLRSDGVHLRAGMVFGFLPECCSAWPESPAGEHLQSFTLAWTVLERRINQFWRLRIAGRGFTGRRLDELCEADRYTMSVVVDMLEVASELSPEQARRIHSLRKSRNKAMHEGRVPTPDIARDCVHLAIEVVGRQWKDLKFHLDTL